VTRVTAMGECLDIFEENNSSLYYSRRFGDVRENQIRDFQEPTSIYMELLDQ